jgi:VanZ family protein
MLFEKIWGRRPALKWGRWAPVAAWMGVIFFFSAQPQSALNLGQPGYVSKLAHVAEYAILAWLIQFARGKPSWRAWWQVMLIAVIYAATDEFHQSFSPGRHPRATDVLIDSLGAAIGAALAAWRSR